MEVRVPDGFGNTGHAWSPDDFVGDVPIWYDHRATEFTGKIGNNHSLAKCAANEKAARVLALRGKAGTVVAWEFPLLRVLSALALKKSIHVCLMLPERSEPLPLKRAPPLAQLRSASTTAEAGGSVVSFTADLHCATCAAPPLQRVGVG